MHSLDVCVLVYTTTCAGFARAALRDVRIGPFDDRVALKHDFAASLRSFVQAIFHPPAPRLHGTEHPMLTAPEMVSQALIEKTARHARPGVDPHDIAKRLVGVMHEMHATKADRIALFSLTALYIFHGILQWDDDSNVTKLKCKQCDDDSTLTCGPEEGSSSVMSEAFELDPEFGSYWHGVEYLDEPMSCEEDYRRIISDEYALHIGALQLLATAGAPTLSGTKPQRKKGRSEVVELAAAELDPVEEATRKIKLAESAAVVYSVLLKAALNIHSHDFDWLRQAMAKPAVAPVSAA
jgi:hypothetical protein